MKNTHTNTHRMLAWLLALPIVLTTLFACREEDNYENYNPTGTANYKTRAEQFKVVWNGMNERYPDWDIDSTDWRAIYHTYLPKMEALDAMNATSAEDREKVASLWKSYYTEMFSNILDQHFNATITFGADTVKCSRFSDKINKLYASDAAFQADYNYYITKPYEQAITVLQRLSEQREVHNGLFVSRNVIIESRAEPFSAVFCTIDDVAYLKFSNFFFTTALKNEKEMQNLVNTCYDFANSGKCKGIIFDLRDNTGGQTEDLDTIIGPLIKEDLLIGQWRHKTGLGRYDYSPWTNNYLRYANARRHCEKFDGKVVALVSGISFSCAEDLTTCAKNLPNGTVIGTRTGGGQGVFMEKSDLTFSGTFSGKSKYGSHKLNIPDGTFRHVDGTITEGVGITADVYLPLDFETYINTGVDNQLNAALDLILGK